MPTIQSQAALLGYWKLDDNNATTTVIDYSGNNYDGTLVDGANNTQDVSTTGSSGVANTAFDFTDGTGYVSVANAESRGLNLGAEDNLTFHLRVNMSSTDIVADGSGNGFSFFGASDGGGLNNKWIFGYYKDDIWGSSSPSGDSLAFLWGDDSGHHVVDWDWSPTADTWYDIALTRDGGDWTLYVDGAQLGSTLTDTFKSGALNAGTDVRFGEDGETWAPSQSTISQVRIYNDTRDVDEVLSFGGADYTWDTDASGNWTTGTNWTKDTAPAGAVDQKVYFLDIISSDRAVTLDADRTVGTLTFNDDDNYTLSGANTLIFDVSSGNAKINVYNGYGNGAHTISSNVELNDNLTVENNSTGTFSISGNIAGTGGLTKSGTGTLTLSGNNTFTGNLVVSGGTLLLGGDERIADTVDVVLEGGTFATGGYSETLRNLTLTADSVIDLGSGSSILTFTDVALNGFDLHIWNWTGDPWNLGGTDQLIVNGALTGGVANSAGHYENIFFYTDNGNHLWQNVSGVWGGGTINGNELTPPVPEPSTYLSGGLLLVLLCTYEYRRRKKLFTK